ncbi:MAG: chromosome segregation protein SMC [Planctomycetota bacterium]|nr:MAG: chromosome segregation protein SMC [Planctomycetota bacterium]
MYLKRIELEGFKSFADRTVIPVQRGLTGIVGPNGCGKSNVVDALLWVMGERSAKTLRADQMDDVIFKGAEGRAPASYAMVEIVLADEEGRIVEAGGEVAIGRRLFRTGESDYLLNGRRVKRKDVRDVLLDTGLGVRSYMVLAQGKIDAVLSANPAERRSVFEEAAGISRYKARKHEAELKLARVAQDLARVEDVHEEVQRRVRSLKIQAGKARRWIELRDRYQTGRIRLAWAESARLRREEADLERRAAELEVRIDAVRRERESRQRRLDQLEKEAGALRERHDALRAQAAETKEKAAALEERVHGLESRAEELEEQQRKETERLAGIRRAEEERGAEDAALLERREELAAARAEGAAVLAAAEGRFQDRHRAAVAHRTRLEELRRGVLAALAERTRHHNAAAAAARDRSEAEGLLRGLERRQAESQGERDRLVAELEAARAELEEASLRAGRDEQRARELIAHRDALREELAQAEAAAAEARREAAAAEARIRALQAVEEEGAGLPAPVRRLLAGRGAGLLLDGISVPEPWDRLVEDLLGRLQHALWIDRRGAAAELADGSFDCFFPVVGPDPVHVVPARPLRALLEGDPERCDALCARLGAVYCVDRSEEAARLAEEHPGALFLSADGEFHGPGFVRTGMLRGEGAEGILARRNARREAEGRRRRAQEAEASCAARAADLAGELQQALAELERLDGSLREVVARRDRAADRVRELERRCQARAEEEEALAAELAALQTRLRESSRLEAEAVAARDEAERRREELSRSLEEAETAGAGIETELEEARGALQEARLEDERRAQELAHLEQRLEAGTRLRRREQEEAERLAAELRQRAERIQDLRRRAETDRAEMGRLLAARADLEQRVEEARIQHERARQAWERYRYGAEGDEDRLEELLSERQELALARQRVQLELGELVRSLADEFQQPLEDLARSQGIADQEPAVGEALAALRAEVAEMRRALDAIGSVNLEALNELEEAEERAGFLGREREDLLAARANLVGTIEDLDSRCRSRFLAAFEAVQGQFEAIFRRLFRGGRAELALEAEADPLTAGIEITVRPPGKELRSIKLLSGGERTLTALALLLAVFRSRPSPFCLLDEVDAALDDANVTRFLDVLEDFTTGTQFMVVTHNKLTMARCERLFGVTMRKAGVSKVVAVDLGTLPEGAAAAPAARVLADREQALARARAAVAEVEAGEGG